MGPMMSNPLETFRVVALVRSVVKTKQIPLAVLRITLVSREVLMVRMADKVEAMLLKPFGTMTP